MPDEVIEQHGGHRQRQQLEIVRDQVQHARHRDATHVGTLVVTQQLCLTPPSLAHQDGFELLLDGVAVTHLAAAQREAVREHHHRVATNGAVNGGQRPEEDRLVQLREPVPQHLVLAAVHESANQRLQREEGVRVGGVHADVEELLDHVALQCRAHATGRRMRIALLIVGTREIGGDDDVAPLSKRSGGHR